MADFITLNGIRLPTMAKMTRTDASIVGKVDRSYRGRIEDNRRHQRRKWSVVTPIKEWAESEAIARHLMGQGFGASWRNGLECDRNGRRPLSGFTGIQCRPGFAGPNGDGVLFMLNGLDGGAEIRYDLQLPDDLWTIGWWEKPTSTWQFKARRADATGWLNGVQDNTVGTATNAIQVSVAGGVVRFAFDFGTIDRPMGAWFAVPWHMPEAWFLNIFNETAAYFPYPGLILTGEADNVPGTMEIAVDGQVDDEAWVQAGKDTTQQAQADWVNNHRSLKLSFREVDTRWSMPL